MKKLTILSLVMFSQILAVKAIEFPYNFTVFPTLENNSRLMETFVSNGGCTFLLSTEQYHDKIMLRDANSKIPFDSILSKIRSFRYRYSNRIFTLIICGNSPANLLNASVSRQIPVKEIFSKSDGPWPSPSSILQSGKHFVIITDVKMSKPFLPLNKTCVWSSVYRLQVAMEYDSWFVNAPTNDLVIYYPHFSKEFGLENKAPIALKHKKNLPDNFQVDKFSSTSAGFFLWKRTGRVPNFLICDPNKLNATFEAANKINGTSKHMFNVLTSSLPLKEIYWKNYDSLVTSGYFSIPIGKKNCYMEPCKDNYEFTPDIFEASGINSNEVNVFLSYPVPEDNTAPLLSFDFSKNKFFPSGGNFKYSNIHFTDSGISLPGKMSYVDCHNILVADTAKPISVSARIFPRKFDSYRIIVSKNFSFALKLFNSYATFTTPVVPGVRDYYAKTKALEINKWNHVVVVFRPHNYISFYLNGQLIDRQKSYGYQVSKNSLMIGANEKGRYFNGVIKDVHIWNRSLRKDEIEALYTGDHPVYKTPLAWYWWLVFSMPILLLLIIIFRTKRSKTKGSETERETFVQQDLPSALVSQATKPQVCFFGDVAIVDSNGENKVNLFPPKILQLFVLIAFYSVGNRRGISSKDIARILWEDYESEKAKNNRKYSMAKLKQILDEIDFIDLEYDNTSWTLHFDADTKFDFGAFETFFDHNSKSVEELKRVIPLLKRGAFLNTINTDCFDMLKSDVANRIIDLLLMLADSPPIKPETKLCIELAEVIFLYDEVNEDAHAIQIRSLLADGKNTLALKSYERFTKRYSELFGEEYKISFKSMCKE